jgi:hypothetical protein
VSGSLTGRAFGVLALLGLIASLIAGYGTVARINELGSASDQTPEQTVLIEEVTVAKG